LENHPAAYIQNRGNNQQIIRFLIEKRRGLFQATVPRDFNFKNVVKFLFLFEKPPTRQSLYLGLSCLKNLDPAHFLSKKSWYTSVLRLI